MQVSSAFQGNQAVSIQAYMVAKIGGIAGQPFAMIAGIGIAGFNAQRQRYQHGLGIFQFIGKFLELEQRLDPGKKLFGIQRLAQEIIGAGFNSAHAIIAVRKPGDHHHGNQAGHRIFFQLAAKFIAGLARHDHIQQHQLRTLVVDNLPGFLGFGGGNDFVAAGGQ